MKETTKTAIAAILDADGTVANATLKAIRRLLNGDEEREPMGRVIHPKEAASICGVTTKTIRDWTKNGGLVPVYGPNKKRVTGYTEESVRALVAGISAKGGAA